jgi:hypothetical protein
MTTYRFRVKYEHDPTSLWRDIVVGADRTLNEFQTVLNSAVGLNQDHLWFVTQDYQTRLCIHAGQGILTTSHHIRK